MAEPKRVTVDVRDMLCAQALAVVAQAVARLALGQGAAVHYNATDVRRDLIIWARDRGHRIEGAAPELLHLTRQR